MFYVVYEMKVKPGRNREFETAWAIVTEAIKKHCGGLGSRLHLSTEPNLYVAYAKWPSEEIYDNNPGLVKFTDEETRARETMRDTTEYIKTVYRLSPVKDLTVSG